MVLATQYPNTDTKYANLSGWVPLLHTLRLEGMQSKLGNLAIHHSAANDLNTSDQSSAKEGVSAEPQPTGCDDCSLKQHDEGHVCRLSKRKHQCDCRSETPTAVVLSVQYVSSIRAPGSIRAQVQFLQATTVVGAVVTIVWVVQSFVYLDEFGCDCLLIPQP